ncbi:MAG TPA: NYN domain-containing protein, partial [Longimicrobiales bacterium]
MAAQFARAPHRGVTSGPTQSAPNAALLIDFDNVTMGIRSDLSKELKNLLNSDIIKGKVAVQRAYADWRRYPQYIVPLAEASVDLIFAPAYGSSKKNATDIRLAIDALELVFTRPEIGTFILLSGDSDFSSLVLKLKEYGKYVIGVGIRESASDLLVQNCDEYYSYSVLSGLTKEDDAVREALDPWVLVENAVRQMAAQGDIMRSDRLKQVMLELDPNFNERELGYSKFSKFLADAVARGCLHLRKVDNGQWEVAPVEPSVEEAVSAAAPERESRAPREEGRGARGRGRERGRGAERRDEVAAESPAPAPGAEVAAAGARDEALPASGAVAADADRLAGAYALLRRAVRQVTEGGGPARDSDVKRRMLELEPGWDESALGFSKFSRFLRQAHDAEVIDLQKAGNGVYEVVLPGGKFGKPGEPAPDGRDRRARRGPAESAAAHGDAPAAGMAAAEAKAGAAEARPAAAADPDAAARADAPAEKPGARAAERSAKADQPEPDGRPAEREIEAESVTPGAAPSRVGPLGIGFRRGTRGRMVMAGPPPLLPGQAVRPRESVNGKAAEPAATAGAAGAAKPARAAQAPELTGLPADADGVGAYLTTRYNGVGVKTAQALIEAFGAANVFQALLHEPDRVREVVGARRADALLRAWQSDLEQRRAGAAAADATAAPAAAEKPAPKPARASRRRGRGSARGAHAEPPASSGVDTKAEAPAEPNEVGAKAERKAEAKADAKKVGAKADAKVEPEAGSKKTESKKPEPKAG